MIGESAVDLGSAPVGIFDSGVGGLSVLREIRSQLPLEPVVYVADSGFGPYGRRGVGYIERRSLAITDFLLGQRAKAIVVACNTATAAIVPLLRERTFVPIIAIEPAVKPAAALSRSAVIGVLATEHTLASDRFSRLVGAHASGVDVLTEACPELVELVERGAIEGAATEAAVARHVNSLLERRADVVVLGCTHFHFLRPIVERIAGQQIRVVDPGVSVALELRRRLSHAALLERGPAAGGERLWTSGDPVDAGRVFAALLGRPCVVERVPEAYRRPPAE